MASQDNAYNSKTVLNIRRTNCNFIFYCGLLFLILGLVEFIWGLTDTAALDGLIYIGIVSFGISLLFFVFWYSTNLELKESAEHPDPTYSNHMSGHLIFKPERPEGDIHTVGSRRYKGVATFTKKVVVDLDFGESSRSSTPKNNKVHPMDREDMSSRSPAHVGIRHRSGQSYSHGSSEAEEDMELREIAGMTSGRKRSIVKAYPGYDNVAFEMNM